MPTLSGMQGNLCWSPAGARGRGPLQGQALRGLPEGGREARWGGGQPTCHGFRDAGEVGQGPGPPEQLSHSEHGPCPAGPGRRGPRTPDLVRLTLPRVAVPAPDTADRVQRLLGRGGRVLRTPRGGRWTATCRASECAGRQDVHHHRAGRDQDRLPGGCGLWAACQGVPSCGGGHCPFFVGPAGVYAPGQEGAQPAKPEELPETQVASAPGRCGQGSSCCTHIGLGHARDLGGTGRWPGQGSLGAWHPGWGPCPSFPASQASWNPGICGCSEL